jgi:hypothetical protein
METRRGDPVEVERSRDEGPIGRARRIYGIPGALAITLWVAPWVLLVGFGILLRVPATRAAALDLMSENHPVEVLTFAGFLGGAILAWVVSASASLWGQARRVGRCYALLGLGLFFLGMEEISWGQRLFGFRSPRTLENVNVQGEVNVHNLWVIDDLAQWVLLGLALLALVGIRAYQDPRFRAVSVPAVLGSCFLAVAVGTGLDLLTYAMPIEPHFDEILAQLSEVVEMLLGVGGLLLVWLNRRMLQRAGPAAGEARAGRAP